MLLEYGAKNFLSFKEGVQVSFRLNSKTPKDLSMGKDFTNVMCIKGANGSGKSNVLEILHFLERFCTDSFSLKPDKELDCKPFFNSKKPIEFYVEFDKYGTLYKYELSIKENKVLKETLYRKKARFTKVIERVGNEFKELSPDFKELQAINLRSNASFISTAFQYTFKSIFVIYSFFITLITNLEDNNMNDYEPEIISSQYAKNDNLLEFMKKIICQSDIGIDDIKIIREEDKITNKLVYIPYFQHTNNGKKYFLRYLDESAGTKSLYNQLYQYYIALANKGVLILDEFDINLHPHILPLLVGLFLDPKVNKDNAQLIFTTHNDEIMNRLGKYRTFLVNKEDNESFGYRLDDLPGKILRPERDISPSYNSGILGGVPKIKEEYEFNHE